MISAEIRPGAAFMVGDQRVLFNTGAYALGGGIHAYAVTADARRFLLTREGEALQESELVVAQHWLDGVRNRLRK